jgi:hypothetical protein
MEAIMCEDYDTSKECDLVRIAASDSSETIRIAAISRMHCQSNLVRFATSDSSAEIRLAAVQRMGELD